MNDRLKFRVWDIEEKTYKSSDYPFFLCDDGDVLDTHFDIRDNEVIVEQCTGLKDKNGKLIYEGDIVITYYKGEPTGQMYIYHWEAPAFYVEPVEKGKPSGRHYYYFAVENERCEVIGNVHENSDLLKNPGNFNVSGENVKGDN